MSRLAALLVAASIVVLTGCGSSGTSNDDTTNTPPSGGPGAGMNSAYRQCLQSNGVTLPSGPGARPGGPGGGAPPSGGPGGGAPPSGGPGGGAPGGGPAAVLSKPAGVDDATWKKAQQACASLEPTP